MEEKGFWALNFIILLALLYKIYDGRIQEKHFGAQALASDSLVTAFLKEVALSDSLEDAKENSWAIAEEVKEASNPAIKTARFKFNPNTLSRDSLLLLGFNAYQINNLEKYIAAGGRISNAKDLGNIYGVDADFLASIKSLIQISSPGKNSGFNKQSGEKVIDTSKKDKIWVDINSANKEELQQLNGVGPYYADKIIEYRTQLGGFISHNQLLEIWRIDSLILEKNKAILKSDFGNYEQLNINAVEKEELAKHPYINWKQANSIVTIRQQHGNYDSTAAVKKSVLINDQVYAKIAPYLSID